jgi:hypothetical protein
MRRLATLIAALVAIGAAAAPAQAARPLLLDNWDYEMQSTRYRGSVGHFEGFWTFTRPNYIWMHIPGYARSQKRPLKPAPGGWLVARFTEQRKCFAIRGGKQNYYRYRQVIRLRPTRVHDMEGEPVASHARLRVLQMTKPCIGSRISGTFLGHAKRRVGPERGGADIHYDSPDGCNPSLVELSASEDDSFEDWDRELSYLWKFSDGGTSTERQPRHSFPGPGVHSATVLIRNVNGSVALGSQAVEVGEPDPDCNAPADAA